jgi:5-methylcytosine-specific restriction endonuclease McrA
MKLIDSILKGYPLPSIFLYKRSEDGELLYDVIDGKQRIESIFMFMGQLRGNKYKVKTQLPDRETTELVDWGLIKRKKLQHFFTGYKLQSIEVSGDVSTIIELFVRINSTGKALTGQEKRHAKYYRSAFLKKAGQLAKRYEKYFRSQKIFSSGQIARMKHVELIAELMVAANTEDVSNKKAALDKVMKADSITGRELKKTVELTTRSLNRVKKMFPKLKTTRFAKVSDFYSLAVLIQKFEREKLILTNKKHNRIAWDLLVVLSTGVDEVREKIKGAEGINPGQEMFRDYHATVQSGTDEITQRRNREQILRGVLVTLFKKKDEDRLFSPEQRRILWNTSAERRCTECHKKLTWEDFTIDHISPYSKGGRSKLKNAALMCRKDNSKKGNRKR